MPQYYGYSSINADKPKTTNAISGADGGPGGVRQPLYWGKKFTLVDEQLVIQDFINSFNIRQGTKVGKPGYGTTIWNYIFAPNTADTISGIENEVRRIASADPRLEIANISVYPKDNGILIELEMAVVPFNQAQLISMFLNQETGSAIRQ